ncbi:hypothetical protein N180_01230 [Pedobacter antarcticus 4BY]|uniref:PLD phosphodiesterase domain-containing protein n=2 Tax=Pedobacter antarcticus TaxID=34086 RepID=A0A081PC62_9SPHI|nr:phospholipase D family protein [Pedobacter antarcticus]KEQ28285.1 hypothetical protein N180_01230 [Pedobacter antarcticus 4BY]SFE47732.1 PLD-like domain-containing protein [Pedobacter antarcticus]
MFSIINNDWLSHFKEQVKGADNVRIISPFITDVMVDHLIRLYGKSEVKIITRYNMNDFRSKVSSLSALRKLVEKGFKVKGIKQLHSKLYLFDNRCAIISSANFTGGGFFGNYELGVKILDAQMILKSESYFEELFNIDPKCLVVETVNMWEAELATATPLKSLPHDLKDYGMSPLKGNNSNRKYFVKFFGQSKSRADQNFRIRDMVEGSHCHFAITFSGKKGRPRRYSDGDIVYLAMMLPNGEYAIFGKAIAIKHLDKRDVATTEDIKYVPWKEDYGVYIRIKDSKFIDATMAECPKMSDLIESLSYESFHRTKMRHEQGETKINVRDSLRQQADVQLSDLGAQWLENKFAIATDNCGEIPDEFIKSLYTPIF